MSAARSGIGQRQHAARRQQVERRPAERFGVGQLDVAARTESLDDVGPTVSLSRPAARPSGRPSTRSMSNPSGARRCSTCSSPVGGTDARVPLAGPRLEHDHADRRCSSRWTFSGLLSSAAMTSSRRGGVGRESPGPLPEGEGLVPRDREEEDVDAERAVDDDGARAGDRPSTACTEAKLKPPAETSKPGRHPRLEVERAELHDRVDLDEAVRLETERDPDLRGGRRTAASST